MYMYGAYSVPAEGEVRGAARVRGLGLDGAAATATAAAAAAAVVQQCVVYSFVRCGDADSTRPARFDSDIIDQQRRLGKQSPICGR